MKKYLSFVLALILFLSSAFSAFATDLSVEEMKDLGSSVRNTAAVDASAAAESKNIEVKAKAAVLMEKSTGKVLYSLNENEKLYPASVTKIMTVLLTAEALDSGKIKLTDSVSCSENAASKGGSQIWLEPGESMTVHELLKAACVYSANDACTLLGEYVAGSEGAFVAEMNRRAGELGMKNTHFDNCTGLDDETTTHLTTAYDVALMSRALLRHEHIKEYSTIWMDSLRDGKTQLVNTNKLVRFYKGATGLKTGTTSKAGCCVSATAERDGMELIAVVMGSENSNDRFNSARNLLDWGFSNYELAKPQIDKNLIHPVKVLHGDEENVGIVAPEISPLLVNKGGSKNITVKAELPETTEAPVEKNSVLGTLIVYSGEKPVAKYELKAENDVKTITFKSALLKLLKAFSK